MAWETARMQSIVPRTLTSSVREKMSDLIFGVIAPEMLPIYEFSIESVLLLGGNKMAVKCDSRRHYSRCNQFCQIASRQLAPYSPRCLHQ